MNTELVEALDILEREKDISRDTLLDAIENSLVIACRNNFGKEDNIHVIMDRETCEYEVYVEKTVVEEVEDKTIQVSLEEAREKDPDAKIGDTVRIDINSKEFGRIATQNAKNAILQKIREEERNSVYGRFSGLVHEVVTGIVQRVGGRSISVNLGKADAILSENEQVRGEILRPMDRIKVLILDVRETPKGPRITVSRTHPDLVKKLFEAEVSEVKDGTVEIMSISREAGSRTKIAVISNDPDVDAVGACVGMNGNRVNAVVSELGGEKIDIVNWDENPARFIENALSPSQVVSVIVDPDENTAKVVVPDYQLSLAIGKEGQNARLAARLTGYKIDIKSETQARDAHGFRMEDYLTDDEEEYEEGYEEGEYVEGEEPTAEYVEEYAEEYVEEGYEEAPAEEVTEEIEEVEVTEETEEAESETEAEEAIEASTEDDTEE